MKVSLDFDDREFLKSKIDKNIPLFVYSDCDSDLKPNKSKVSKKSQLLSKIFLYSVMAFMLILYCCSIYINIKHKLGFGKVLGAVFPLGVTFLLIVLSAEGLWGKIATFASKHKTFQNKDYGSNKSNIDTIEKSEELDLLRKYDNSLYIYDDLLIIKEVFDYSSINMSDILRVEIDKLQSSFLLQFVLNDDKIIKFPTSIPNKRIADLRARFKCRVVVNDKRDPKERKQILLQKLPIALFTLIFVMAGIGLMIAHKYVPDIPLFLGIFFTLGGTIAFCGAMGAASEIMHDVVIPCLFSAIFLTFTIGFIGYLMGKANITNPFLIFIYAPITIVLIFFISIGAFLLLTSLIKFVKIIKR